MDAGVKEVYLVGKAWGKRGKRPSSAAGREPGTRLFARRSLGDWPQGWTAGTGPVNTYWAYAGGT